MNKPYPVILDRTKTPTAAAQDLWGQLLALQEQGRVGQGGIFNFGLAAEEGQPEGLFEPCLAEAEVCGSEASKQEFVSVEELAARYLRHFLGAYATAQNTFVLSNNGRGSLSDVFEVAAGLNRSSKAGITDQHWSMYRDLMNLVRSTELVTFRVPQGDALGEDCQEAIQKGPFVLINNNPNNPTGKFLSKAWQQSLHEALDTYNASAVEPISHVIDSPCFFAHSKTLKARDGDAYFQGGYDAVTPKDSKTPWFLVISFSKALGKAFDRLSFVVVNPAFQSHFRQLLEDKQRLDLDAAFREKVGLAFHPAKHVAHKKHFGKLRHKYRKNHRCLKSHIEAVVSSRDLSIELLDGDPGITAVLKVDGLLGQQARHEGRSYVLHTTADLVEYLANRGVVLVDNGQDDSKAYLRLSLDKPTDNFEKGVRYLTSIFDEFRPISAAKPALRGQRRVHQVSPTALGVV